MGLTDSFRLYLLKYRVDFLINFFLVLFGIKIKCMLGGRFLLVGIIYSLFEMGKVFCEIILKVFTLLFLVWIRSFFGFDESLVYSFEEWFVILFMEFWSCVRGVNFFFFFIIKDVGVRFYFFIIWVGYYSIWFYFFCWSVKFFFFFWIWNFVYFLFG